MVTTTRYELPVSPEDREVTAARLWAAGALGVWEQPDALVAWFSDPPPPLPDELRGGTTRTEPDVDWQADWKATVAPVRAGRFHVVPTWLAHEHPPEPGELTLVLDPGRAFGSGHHATTTLCLEALDDLDRAGGLVDRRVADVGTGSGILAIGAARLGARATGSDVDPQAVDVAAGNAARNGVEVTLATGSVAAALAPHGGDADVVVANLVTDTIVALADDLVDGLAPNGTLIVSGIAAERLERVTTALRAAGAELDPPVARDGWVRLTGRRAGAPVGAEGGPSATLRA